MKPQVLQLDIQGTPQAWISLEQAASHYATNCVIWEDGAGPLATMRGGFNVASGMQSKIEISPIIALKGCAKVNLFDNVPSCTRRRLFARDRYTCAYCAQRFREQDLTCEHIVPESRGGEWSFMNLVSACALCNSIKRDRTPSEAGMALCYLPYRPSLWESFLLDGRNIRADVHSWLASRLPKESRLN